MNLPKVPNGLLDFEDWCSGEGLEAECPLCNPMPWVILGWNLAMAGLLASAQRFEGRLGFAARRR